MIAHEARRSEGVFAAERMTSHAPRSRNARETDFATAIHAEPPSACTGANRTTNSGDVAPKLTVPG